MLLRRAVVVLGAQAVSSVTNFAVSALALASGTLAEFGRFAIVMQVCQIVIAVGHGLTADTVLMIASRDAETSEARGFSAAAASVSVVAGATCGVVILCVAALSSGDLATGLTIAAIGSPGLMLQYTARSAYFARQMPGGALVLDLVWLGVLGAAGLADVGGWEGSPNGYLLAWVIGAYISGAPALGAAITAGWRGATTFWLRAGRAAIHLAVESLIARAVFLISLLTVRWMLDDAASGALAAATLLFTPLSVVQAGVSAVVVPSQVGRKDVTPPLRRIAVACSAFVVGVTLAWATVLLVLDATPVSLGPFALERNDVSLAVFGAVLLRFVALAVWRGPLVSFRIAGDTYDSLMARIVGTVAQVLLPPIGIWVGGLASGVLALGIGTTIGALEAWRRLMTR